MTFSEEVRVTMTPAGLSVMVLIYGEEDGRVIGRWASWSRSKIHGKVVIIFNGNGYGLDLNFEEPLILCVESL
jgi:hypothetical protein